MAELKTSPNDRSVDDFIAGVADPKRREECRTILKLMQRVTKAKPKMWGTSIVGFGSYHYRYASGREGDWFLSGFSPRKQNLTLYVMSGFARQADLMRQLGKYKTGSSCLYIKSLEDIDLGTLETLVRQSVEHMRKNSA